MNDQEKYLNFRRIDDQTTELFIYGDIRKKTWIDAWFGTSKDCTEAYTLKDALAAVDTPNLNVRINSYGGSVSEGLAIYGLLSDFKGHLKTIVDGFACSAASVIFMAGQERIVPINGVLMIHNAWASATGDSNEMKKIAEDLEKITRPSLDIYVEKTGLPEERVQELMNRETWITSKEAYDWGFSTSQSKNEEMQQSLEANFVCNLINENKELTSKLEKYANVKEFAKEILNQATDILNKSKEKNAEHDNKKTDMNKSAKNDAWASFFNK